MILSKTRQQTITTLESVITQLQSGNYRDVMEQIEDLSFTDEELSPYMTWSKKKYTRNCIAHNEFFELVLLCWEKGQKTAIHGHDNQECMVKIISGSFAEALFQYNEETKEMEFISSEMVSEDELTMIESSEIFHSLQNINDGRSISLHLYMKPILKCKVYDTENKCLVNRELQYDQVGLV